MTTAYPLEWPRGRPRTDSYRLASAKFSTTFAIARDELLREVKRLGASECVISTNIALRQDGLPYANTRRLDDEGVAVYFTYKGKAMCFACDRWNRVEHNMHAIVKTIDALRGVARWGTGDMLEAAFTGFLALAAPTSRNWWDVLRVSPTSPPEVVRHQYRVLRSQNHPQNGGTQEAFNEIEDAFKRSNIGLAT